MNKCNENNSAFIDGANLFCGIKDSGWILDYRKFRIWLLEKYSVKKAYLFIGFVKKYEFLYRNLKNIGYILIFKETVSTKDGKIKGNCDADLVLSAAQGAYENLYDRVILVSSDGDYVSLVKFLVKRNKFKIILSPDIKCSLLLKRVGVKIVYLNDQKNILEAKNKKAPDTD